MAAVALPPGTDLPRISSFLSLPEDTIQAFASLPNDFIASILESLGVKAKEYDELKADKLRLGVELEQTVRKAETKTKSMKSQLDGALQETQELRTKLNQLEREKAEIESGMSNFRSSVSGQDEEARQLKAKVQRLEFDKRDALETLDRKIADYERLQNDYQALHEKVLESRKEVSRLESQLQQAQSAQTTSKFKEQTLQQELQLLKNNNDYLESELSAKTAELQKTRKEQRAKISELQRELDEALQQASSEHKTSESLRERLTELTAKSESILQEKQELKEQAVVREEAFRHEMETQQRLTRLYKEASESARARVEELDRQVGEEQHRVSVEAGRAEAERREKENAERKIMELEVQVERLEADLSTLASSQSMGMPQTPRGNGSMTPVRPGTPGGVFSPAASRLQKAGISMTQLYSDYNAVKTELEAEKRRNEKLQVSFDELIRELEMRVPEMEEQREEHERLQSEMLEMSHMMESVSKERDEARTEVQRLTNRIGTHEKEANIMRQQLRDLSFQVQVLLTRVEMGDQLTPADQERFVELARERAEAASNQTPTDRLITKFLLTFRSIEELQEQNQKLINITREVGRKLEEEEARTREIKDMRQAEQIENLQKELDMLREELRILETKANSYVRERDMFRRMVENRGGDVNGSEFHPEESFLGGASQIGHHGENARAVQEYANLLRDTQAQFDNYRNEVSSDMKILQEQAQKLSTEKTELQIAAAKLNSQLELANERFNMLTSNFNMLKNENQELQKRVTTLHEQNAKQDNKTQQIAEELVDTKTLLESHRTELANLKAEKNLWKSIEVRLTQDNENLNQERSRLNAHIASLNAIQSEREREDSESRRRLVAQVEKLESDLQNSKRRLGEEVEEAQKSVMRKEHEVREVRRKMDELNETVGKVREEWVEAKTQRDALQSRVNELTAELKSAEEKLSVLSKPTAPDADASREEELAMQVADLTKDLEIKTAELENLKEQVENYKRIAASAEEELETMNSTHDAFKESMDKAVEERDATIADVRQRLTETNEQLNAARKEADELQRQVTQQKSSLESEIERLNAEVERRAAASTLFQEDLKTQAQIAQEAQQNYEAELIRHGEARTALQHARAELAELKSEFNNLRSEAESARSSLENSEASWAAQRENYEKEVRELNTRVGDLSRQNKLLLEQLENVGSQISELQKSRMAQDEDAAESITGRDSGEDLREVIRYLRREKEIVDVQYELAQQEASRLKQQFSLVRSQLDEANLKLSQERERELTQLKSASSQKELLDKISELNILRESNTTLRTELENKGSKLNDVQSRLDAALAQVQPLEEKVRNLEAEIEVKDGQVKLLEEDNQRWKDRAQQILQKYDRIDPAELEGLKTKVSTLEQEKTTLDTENAGLKEENEQLKQKVEQTVVNWRAKLDKLVTDTKERLRQRTETINASRAEIESLKAELANAKTELEGAKAERDAALQSVEQVKASMQQGAGADVEAANARATQLEGEKGELQRQLDEARSKSLSNEMEKVQISQQLAAIQQEHNQLKVQFEDLVQKAATAETPAPAVVLTGDAANDEAVVALQNTVAELTTQVNEYQAQIQALETEKEEAKKKNDEFQQGMKDKFQAYKQHVLDAQEKHKQALTQLQNDKAKLQQLLEDKIAELLAEQENKIAETRESVRQEFAQKEAELNARITELEQKLAQAGTADAGAAATDAGAAARIAELEQQLAAAQAQGASSAAPAPVSDEQAAARIAELEKALQEEKAKTTAKTQEEIKAIVKKNVEFRVGKEKAAWEKEFAAQQEEQQKERDAANVAALEAAKESARQEGAMRAKVQVSMLEKKNKDLAEKVKKLEAELSSAKGETPATPSAVAVPATPAQQPARPPSQASGAPSGIPPPTTVVPVVSAFPAAGQTPAQPQSVFASQPSQPQSVFATVGQPAPVPQQQQQSGLPAPSSRQSLAGRGMGTAAQGLKILQGNAAQTQASGIPQRGRGIPRPGQGGRGGHAQQQQGQQQAQQQQSELTPQQAQLLAQINAGGQPAGGAAPPSPAGSVTSQGQPSHRGSGIPAPGRGRGRGGHGGMGRGIPAPQVVTNLGGGPPQQGQAQASPLNAQAKQFVPGKRGREGVDEGEQEGAGRGGKRTRGQ